ncbi:MAG: hypothetical protein ABW002_00770 [Xanthomonas sp.]
MVPLLLASVAADASDGLIRFSGHIVDPPCAVGRAGADIVLERCPLAARGAAIQVMPLDDAAPARLLDNPLGKGQRSSVSTVRATALADNALSFSSRYRLSAADGMQTPTSGRYLVTVDYL